ncbi:MAG: signal peptidase I [Psychromonas sp.]|nr:signal peptidase I [Alteromonadales bacterium]MCP5076950.1 signal peptidase I [Psychromonas sp.]
MKNKLIIYLLLLCPLIFLSSFLFTRYDFYFIPTGSMKPTILAGDYVLVDTLAYQDSTPKRADIILFNSPIASNNVLIKRVFGIPDDKIAYSHSAPQLLADSTKILNSSKYDIHYVEPLHYFVLGDNFSGSQDSRYFSSFHQSEIIGKAVMIVLSQEADKSYHFTRVQKL